MLKVVIADDEAHICRLIQALVDWQSMEMEVVGVASNGIEAIELVDKLLPDILITDIRMPGCNGLELIQHVKTINLDLEVIIISGYAHFPYAQTAMRYGVGNYLLKPINKIELIQTLEELKLKIEERKESENGLEQLIQLEQNTKRRMQRNFIDDLLDDKITDISVESLREEYGLAVQEGRFQIFCIKMDYDIQKISENAIDIVKEKTKTIIAGNLQNICTEYVFFMDNYWGYGILNYETKKQDDVRRVIRQCLNQLIIQKSILGPIEFTIALEESTKSPNELSKTLHQCKENMKERIVIGAESVIENVPKERGFRGKNLLEGYVRIITHAVETMNQDEASKALQYLKQSVVETKNLRGYEVLDLVISAGTLFIMQVKCENQKQMNDDYVKRCEQSNSIQMLFEQLNAIHIAVINILQIEHDNDILRPIRIAKNYIQNHYQEQITLEQVSDVVGLSSSYFSALFKKEVGEGFAKYLIHIRIEAAKVLLRESTLSVSAICKEVGYNDSKHFTSTFEKAAGLKPSAYRKLYG